jgi:hypothetical protein
MVVYACLLLMVILFEFVHSRPRNFGWFGPELVLGTMAATILVLRGIAELRSSRWRRVLYSLPCWLLWIVWAQARLLGVVALAIVPALSFALYVVALDVEPRQAATPGR